MLSRLAGATRFHRIFTMTYQFFAKTDTGRVRNNNEDSVVFDDAQRLLVLADGMGGYNAGEVASSMATRFIQTEMVRWLSEVGQNVQARDVRRALQICVDNANLEILNAAISNPAYAGMGTTLVLAVFVQQTLVVGHIGDSRCYRLRGGELQAITRDHSLLQEQLDAGLVTPEEAANSTIKNLVTRALGVEVPVLLELNEFAVEPGDQYLLCSDGLTDMVSDALIAKIMESNNPLHRKAEQLVDCANDNGGRDNISVILASFQPEQPQRGWLNRWLSKHKS
jgi:protein phosphatase